ncbi:MAG: rod shape-determining protein [Roseivirga sp.]
MAFMENFRSVIGIEAGTKRLRIIREGKLSFDEPAIISVDKTSHKVSGLGNSLVEGTGHHVVRPIEFAIKDFEAFELLVKGAIKQLEGKKSWYLRSYKMYMILPTDASEVEKRAYRDSAEHANAVSLYMIYGSIAAGLGMNVLIKKKSFILVDFGASKFEVTVFSNAMIRHERALRLGTDHLELTISNHLYRAYKVKAKEDEIRLLINTYATDVDLITVQSVNIPMTEIAGIVEHYLWLVEDQFRTCLENIDPRILTRVLENGIYLTGGGSLYKNLCIALLDRLDLKYEFSKNPLHDNINGLQQIMASPKDFKEYLLV